jgi:hypothetical protein
MFEIVQQRIQTLNDRMFRSVTEFFSGRPSVEKIKGRLLEEFPGQTSNSIEWDLNQSTADIALNDIQSTLRMIIPEYIIKKYNKINGFFLLFYLTDDICLSEGEKPIPEKRITNPTPLFIDKAFLIYQKITHQSVARCITLHQAVRSMIPVLRDACNKFIFHFQMSINFTSYFPDHYFIKTKRFQSIRGPDFFKFLVSKFFHPRN